MGRKRKFKMGRRVSWSDMDLEGNPYRQHGVVVDYSQDAEKRGRYRVIRIHGSPTGGQLYGPPFYLDSWLLADEGTTYRRAVGTYRRNEAIGDRGCACNCCLHVARSRSSVRLDGTFVEDVSD